MRILKLLTIFHTIFHIFNQCLITNKTEFFPTIEELNNEPYLLVNYINKIELKTFENDLLSSFYTVSAVILDPLQIQKLLTKEDFDTLLGSIIDKIKWGNEPNQVIEFTLDELKKQDKIINTAVANRKIGSFVVSDETYLNIKSGLQVTPIPTNLKYYLDTYLPKGKIKHYDIIIKNDNLKVRFAKEERSTPFAKEERSTQNDTQVMGYLKIQFSTPLPDFLNKKKDGDTKNTNNNPEKDHKGSLNVPVCYFEIRRKVKISRTLPNNSSQLNSTTPDSEKVPNPINDPADPPTLDGSKNQKTPSKLPTECEFEFMQDTEYPYSILINHILSINFFIGIERSVKSNTDQSKDEIEKVIEWDVFPNRKEKKRDDIRKQIKAHLNFPQDFAQADEAENPIDASLDVSSDSDVGSKQPGNPSSASSLEAQGPTGHESSDSETESEDLDDLETKSVELQKSSSEILPGPYEDLTTGNKQLVKSSTAKKKLTPTEGADDLKETPGSDKKSSSEKHPVPHKDLTTGSEQEDKPSAAQKKLDLTEDTTNLNKTPESGKKDGSEKEQTEAKKKSEKDGASGASPVSKAHESKGGLSTEQIVLICVTAALLVGVITSIVFYRKQILKKI